MSRQRGAAAVLFVFFMVLFCCVVALAVDVGYMMLVRTELQSAVDSAALAGAGVLDQSHEAVVSEAIRYARMHRVGGQPLELSSREIIVGQWDDDRKEFRATPDANAVLIQPSIQRGLFFSGIFGSSSFRTGTAGSASIDAIATSHPRDIAFVVDLSGWANAESEIAQAKNSKTKSQADMNKLLANLYQDFGIETAEVRSEFIGAPLGARKRPISEMAEVGGLLSGSAIPSRYRVNSDDTDEVRMRKAYSWVIENQIAPLMPKAIPSPAEIENYDYWVEYIDYLLQDDEAPAPETAVVSRGHRSLLPPGHRRRVQRIEGFQNNKKAADQLQNQIFYASYFQFMSDVGRDSNIAGRYPAISTLSGESPATRESTVAGDFFFPPREQPLHLIRRALIAATHTLQSRNTSTAGRSMGDRISVITFDRALDRDPNTPGIAVALTDDYRSVMESCAQLQACADDAASTSTDAGMREAWFHLLPEEEGGRGRSNAKKIVFLITVGTPDAYISSPGQIETYIAARDNKNFYGGGNYAYDAALMYADKMHQRDWQVIPIGVGPNADYKFIERMAKITGAYDGNKPPKFDKSPEDFEPMLTKMMAQMLVTSPNLVQ